MTEPKMKGVRLKGNAAVDMQRRIIKLYKDGKPIREISEQVGRSYGYVHRVIAEAPGVKFRSRGGGNRKGTKAAPRMATAGSAGNK